MRNLFFHPGRENESRKIFKIEFEKFDAIYKEVVLHVKLYASAVIGDQNYVDATAPDMTDAIPLLNYYFLNRKNDSSKPVCRYPWRLEKTFFLLFSSHKRFPRQPPIQ